MQGQGMSWSSIESIRLSFENDTDSIRNMLKRRVFLSDSEVTKVALKERNPILEDWPCSKIMFYYLFNYSKIDWYTIVFNLENEYLFLF